MTLRTRALLLIAFTSCGCAKLDAPALVTDMSDGLDMSLDQVEDLPIDQPIDRTPDSRPAPQCGDLDTCGQLCVDLKKDPTNCGQCGRTCILPNAIAACVDGECAIGQCQGGYFDEDKDFKNGCESQNQCQADAPCMTVCGTQGSIQCQDNKAVCQVPAEQCNGRDDNCDNQCDEGAMNGCRRGIHRGRGNGHIYSDNTGDLPVVESNNYFYLYQNDPQGNADVVFKPVYLCTKPGGKKFITQSTNCEINRGPDKQLGFWATSAACGAVPLYRLYHSEQNNHFFTTSAPERDNAVNNLGYRFERIAGYVWPKP